MKTAISLPDELYETVERLAERMRTSRSQLYRAALEEYVARHEPDEIRESLDAVAEELEDRDVVSGAARKVLENTEW
ncbi:MAG: ribbon-helix-helix protein, CopG family [Acidobacteria bacterium]|nr:ribbon-helix-helix protein, CopG family [Acidobacteriota bacterium]